VSLAQLRCLSCPRAFPCGTQQLVATNDQRRATPDQRPGTNDDEAARLLAFRLDKILIAVGASQRGDLRLRPLGQHLGVETGNRSGDADSRDRVPEIVLAVPERTLAVLPRLAPVDRRQRDEKRIVALLRRERAALLERVPVGRVVVHAGG